MNYAKSAVYWLNRLKRMDQFCRRLYNSGAESLFYSGCLTGRQLGQSCNRLPNDNSTHLTTADIEWEEITGFDDKMEKESICRNIMPCFLVDIQQWFSG